ncbi:unnamed protein product [Pelagomonas calceolata]|uniref:Amidohydrolase 3 domain-containing protein n=1 Tax=Pelagomonas calceolata TaxID=35677 RepID=A0A8J2SZB8_9STRA|nr:unnamed protein product [Pelagomonas calceolata]
MPMVAIQATTAALLFFNGTIRTNTRSLDAVVAPALCFDSVVRATGSLEAVAAACPGARRVDLGGATAVPGLTDSHAHIMLEAARRRKADLSSCEDATACASVLAKWGAAHPLQNWVQGFGFDQTSWAGGKWPTRHDLDVIRRPARADHISGHAVWVNSAALRAANVTRATKSPPGGTIVRDALGRPTGILTDDAMDLIDAVVPPPRASAVDASFQAVLEACAAAGLTGVHDLAALPGDIDYYSSRADQLTLRLNVYRDAASHDQIPPVASGESRLVRVRGAKFFCDGAMGSWTAAMLAPYSDRPSTKGTLIYNASELLAGVKKWNNAGYQVSAHAIGDAANRQVLDVYEQAGVAPSDRFRVEHVQILSEQDLPRFARLGVIPSMQTTHCASDLGYADARLGARANLSYAWRALKDSGVAVLPLGSDFPTGGTIPPLLGLHAGITRERPDGTPSGGWHPEERLTPLETLRGYTADAAFAGFSENELGALEPGYKADITVLAADPVTCDPARLPGLAVLGTVVGGDVVYAAPRGPLAGLARPKRAFAGPRLSERALSAAAAWERRLVDDTAEDRAWARPWEEAM